MLYEVITRAIRRLSAAITSSKAEILHTHNAMANYYGALAALSYPRVRLVNSRHGMGAVSQDALKERLFRLSLMRTAAVAVVCNRAAEHRITSYNVCYTKLLRVQSSAIRCPSIDRSTSPGKILYFAGEPAMTDETIAPDCSSFRPCIFLRLSFSRG